MRYALAFSLLALVGCTAPSAPKQRGPGCVINFVSGTSGEVLTIPKHYDVCPAVVYDGTL